MNNKYDQVVSILPKSLSSLLMAVSEQAKENIQEICLRIDRPIVLRVGNKNFFLNNYSKLITNINSKLKIVLRDEIEMSFKNMCNHSIYSYQDEIKNGYVTIKGGHRVGIGATAVLAEGEVSSVRDISSLNIRLSRQFDGAAKSILGIIKDDFQGILLAGPPASGKTTILRAFAKELSLLDRKVTVVDERNEISGTYLSIAQNDLGLSDILNGYPKYIGMIQAIRSMAPEILICDEIGLCKDVDAIEEVVHSGVRLIASVHIGSINEIFKRNQVERLLQTQAFDTVVMLNSNGQKNRVEGIYKVGDKIGEISRIYGSNNVVNNDGLFSIA